MLAAVALLALAGAAEGGTAIGKCWRREIHSGIPVQVYQGDRKCHDLGPPVKLRGVWIDEFEGSRFVENARLLQPALNDRRRIWLNTDEIFDRNFAVRPEGVGIIYQVELIGRRAPLRERGPGSGYGHFGMSEGLIVVDRFLSRKKLGQIPQLR